MPAVPFNYNHPNMQYQHETSYDYARRISEDVFTRFQLTDVQETEEYEEDFFGNRLHTMTPRKSRLNSIGSTGTTSSMDALWELHPRRLSEAGLSRHSDNSGVLTEDTDSFIIGQRVWVGGTKPGQIAYIGETQFAPGEWGGIVLDQPIGKNDGTVGGVRYFQCEPKKGVFSRLTRLTRFPLDTVDHCTTPSPTNGVRKSPISPTGSTRSALNASNTSLVSVHVDFKVGDRVIIKSSQGSKIGTLRYMGFTSFANGEWCGVELDEPRGKNDGSVEGKRYFECRPNYGLFAPVAKISKSPSSRKPSGNCVVHPNAMRRGNSRESLTSMTSLTSATSAARRVRLGVTSLTPKRTPPKASSTPVPSRTALQDVLKEKQQHIEQLLKERDIERAEITRAASQADEAEQKFASLKQEFEQYCQECDKKFRENGEALEKLKAEYEEVLSQLDDEKRKNEDLQFKFEEAAITKGDIERDVQMQTVANEENVARIAALVAELSETQARAETKIFEATEELAKLSEENASLKIQLEHANEKRNILEAEESKSIDLVQSLQLQLEESNETLKKNQEMSLKTIEELDNKLSRQISEFEVKTFKYEKEIEDAKSKYTVDLSAKVDELETLKKELLETKNNLEAKTKELDVLKYETQATDSSLKKDLDKAKMDISAKVLEIESQAETIKEKNLQISQFETDLTKLKEEHNKKLSEIEVIKKSSKETEDDLKNELEVTKEALKVKESEILALTESKLSLEASQNEENKTLISKLKEVEANLQETTKKFESKAEELSNVNKVVSELKDEVAVKVENIKDLEERFSAVTSKLAQESQAFEETKSKLSQLELEIGDYKRSIQVSESKLDEIQKQKVNLEEEIKTLCSNSGESSAKLESLNSKLREKEKELEQIRDESAQNIQKSQHLLQEKEIELQNANTKSLEEIHGLKSQLEGLQKELEKSKEKCKLLVEEKSKNQGELVLELEGVKEKLGVKEKELVKSLETLEEVKSCNLGNEEKVNSLVKEVEGYKEKVESLRKESQVAEEKVKNKIIETSSEIEKQKTDYENKIIEITNDLNKKCSLLEEEISKLKQGEAEKDTVMQQKVVDLNNLNKKLMEMAENESKSQEISKELNNKVVALEEEINRLKSLETEQDAQLQAKVLELKNLNEKLVETMENVKKDQQSLLDKEIESKTQLESKLKTLENEINNKNSKINELESQLDLTKNDVNSNLITMESNQKEIDKLASDLQATKNLAENIQKEKEIALKETEQSLLKEKQELANKINDLAKQSEQTESAKQILEMERSNYQQLLSVLRISEKQKSDLLKGSKGKDLEKLVQSLKVEKGGQEIDEFQKQLGAVNDALKKSQEQVRIKDMEILRLEQNVKKAQESVKIEEISDESITNNNKVSNAYTQLMAEKLFAESQVNFLNSIIADMQKKNEEQKARIEILESGYNPAEADEFKVMGLTERKIPPRQYCDICEEFDLHETEDCPLQATEDMPAPAKEKIKTPPRPYCEICEMFGHLTEDCQEDQTY